MPEPTTTTTTASVAAASLTGAPLIILYPTLGDYGIVALAAFAAALVQLSATDKLDWSVSRKIMLIIRVFAVSLALTGAVSWLLVHLIPAATPIPAPVALALTSFGLGLLDGNWSQVMGALGSWLLKMLPERKPTGSDK